jgi:hypothetical protein
MHEPNYDVSNYCGEMKVNFMLGFTFNYIVHVFYKYFKGQKLRG